MPPDVVSIRALNRTLLRRQLLLEPSTMGVMESVRHLVGLQAQVPTNPYVGLRARLAGFEPATLEALVEAGDAVRIVAMRATIHLLVRRFGAA